jgi:hypothetical protein
LFEIDVKTRVGDVPGPCGCAGHGFVYRKGEFSAFDVPGAQMTSTGVNQRGDIVGIYTDPSNRRHGFLAPRAARMSH